MRDYLESTARRFVIPVLVVVVILVGVVATFRGNPRLGSPSLFSGVIVTVYRRSLYLRWGRMYLGRDPQAPGKRTYIFRDDGIAVTLPGRRGRIDWSLWTGVVETDAFYLFLVKGRLPHPVPKSAFRDQEDRDRFRSLVTGHARRARLMAEDRPAGPGPESAT